MCIFYRNIAKIKYKIDSKLQKMSKQTNVSAVQKGSRVLK